MGRTKTSGIYATGNTYEIDKTYAGERIRQCGFESFEEAENWLIQKLEKSRAIRLYGVPVKRTFAQASARYVKQSADEVKASLESDIYLLKVVMPYIGHLTLEEIHNDSEELKAFIKDRRDAGCKNKTINLSLGAVRRILNLAARSWRHKNNQPWLIQEPPLISMLDLSDQRPPRPITWDEQRRLLPNLAGHLAAMALFVLHTGIRDDVVCNLQWEWEVPIPQLGVSAFLVPKEHVKGIKSNKVDRVIMCNAVAQSVIEEQRGQHCTHVFTYRGHHIRGGMNNTGWQNGRELAGLGDLHVHDLRHTVGMRLREAGVAEETIADILWHRRKSMTAHYSMAQLVELHQAVVKIENETHRWNISLMSLIRDRDTLKAQVTGNLPDKKIATQTVYA